MSAPCLNQLPKEKVLEGNTSTPLNFNFVVNSEWGAPRPTTASLTPALVGREEINLSAGSWGQELQLGLKTKGQSGPRVGRGGGEYVPVVGSSGISDASWQNGGEQGWASLVEICLYF